MGHHGSSVRGLLYPPSWRRNPNISTWEEHEVHMMPCWIDSSKPWSREQAKKGELPAALTTHLWLPLGLVTQSKAVLCVFRVHDPSFEQCLFTV